MAEGPQADWVLWALLAAGIVAALLVVVVALKGRRFREGEVFVASRLTRGNRLFPTQVAIGPASVIQHRSQWFGREEHSIHIGHVASVTIDTGLLFSDVIIESSGGSEPIVCHGHSKADAVRMKELIEGLQSERAPQGAARTEGLAAAYALAGGVDAGATKVCPFCAETIKAAATVCRYCGRDQPAK